MRESGEFIQLQEGANETHLFSVSPDIEKIKSKILDRQGVDKSFQFDFWKEDSIESLTVNLHHIIPTEGKGEKAYFIGVSDFPSYEDMYYIKVDLHIDTGLYHVSEITFFVDIDK